ncbi:hypothetical protein [Streptomyces sp. NBC_00035]|uniref:hypothetical protein n=1 Tax=Streptomyces sp. NBC_00035 TaxID=2903614 RepID=UPI003252EE07
MVGPTGEHHGGTQMIEFTFPELPEESLSLSLDRTGRSSGDPVPTGPPLEGRVSLGGPLAVPVTSAYTADDKDLAAFVEQEAARAVYHVVHLAVAMAPEPKAPRLDSVRVELDLSAHGVPAASVEDPPIAWSMAPSKIKDEVEIGTTLRLGPQLKIAPVQATLGEISRTRTVRRSRPLLEAVGELSARPRWVMRGTKDVPLTGSQRLVLVVRVPIGIVAEVATTVHASVVKGSILRRYVRQLPGALSLSTVV